MNLLELSLLVEESKFVQSAIIRHCYEIYGGSMARRKKSNSGPYYG